MPGVTDAEIRIGITYFANGSQAAQAAGVNLERGDEKKNFEAAIAEVNARGGVAGRRLVAVYYGYDSQSTQTIESQEQAACVRFTQDERVFAVVTAATRNGIACLHRAGVLHATPGSYLGPDETFMRRFPTYFVHAPSQDRMQADLVTALGRQAYFGGWDHVRGAPGPAKPKIGILVVDRPEFTETMDKVLLPALKRAGHTVDRSSIYPIPLTPSAQESAPAAAATQGAVLGLRQQGVTHVVMLDANGSTTLFFLQQASNQGYYPRLGFGSASGVQQLYDLKTITAQQVNGAVGLGWTPTLDLPAGEGKRYLSSAAPFCLDVIKKRSGQAPASTTAEGIALLACDAIFPLAEALKRAGRDLSLAGAVRALESLGKPVNAANVPKVFFSPTRHTGVETAFDMSWDPACPCVRYRDNGHRMP